jgi:hypothetical protein
MPAKQPLNWSGNLLSGKILISASKSSSTFGAAAAGSSGFAGGGAGSASFFDCLATALNQK